MPSEPHDRVDRAILDALQRDGRMANVDLAEQVALSPSTCLRRTKALEAEGIIAGYRAELDRERIDLELTAFVSLKVDQRSRQTSLEIESALIAIPAVVACHVVTGDADFLIEVAVPHLRAYERVLLDQILAIEPITDARTSFTIRTVLDRGPLPLDHWPPSTFPGRGRV